ncbi:MAG: helix-turn-helix transcriptional regulator [Acidimicrobiales bacterium]
MTRRDTAATRIGRLLAILQWAAARPDGVAVEDLCARFRLAPDALVKELGLASMVGADSPHYDDMPFEVYVEDGLVYVRLFSFRRPLRLTAAEGLALVAAADVLVDDDDPEAPLARALAKLAELLGIEAGTTVDVDLDVDGGPTGRLLRDAVDRGRQVSFTYWTYGRDAVATRVVDPWRVFSGAGAWYLVGRAHDVGEERRFRLDRMEDVAVVDAPVEEGAPRDLDLSVTVAPSAPQVVLDLAPAARWVTDAHPVLAVQPRRAGVVRVTMAVAGRSWLERLLLQLGPDATVVSVDEELGDASIAALAARRTLARYRGRASEGSR